MSTNMNVPMIELYANLIVPIHGALGEGAMARLTDGVTRRIADGTVRGLVIDVSAVDVMDSYVTRNIRDLALAARLMGVATVVSGLRPAGAIALGEMGLEMGGFETTLDLARAIDRLARIRAEEDGTDGGGGDARV
jgi:rsbT antagonist protein RsbS